MKKDFLVVGQGIAGSLLAFELMQKGYQVAIADASSENTSSKKAAGLYNPITGREMKKTWIADLLFANIELHYRKLEVEIEEKFLFNTPIYRPFHSAGEQNDWLTKYQDEAFSEYIDKVTPSLEIEHLQDPFGGIQLKKSGYVDLPRMLGAFRKYFERHEMLISENIDPLQGQDIAERIIHSEGPYVSQNSHWGHLPFRPVRGEVLNIRCDLPTDKIYNRGVFILPKDDYFRVGSTYHHDILSFVPQEKGIEELKRRLAKLFTGDYEILNASAGVRPATHDRRPYIGWHPENKTLGIFNGFGAKGVSLVPYFSKLFVDSIEGNAVIPSEAHVSRVF